jgi:hypothetical protein
MRTTNGETATIAWIIGVLLLSCILGGCGATRPTNDEAITQMTSYIQQCPSWERIGPTFSIDHPPLSTVVRLVNLTVVDTRQVDSATVEIVFSAQYEALIDFQSIYMGKARSVLPPGNYGKGTSLNVTGITTRFQRYEQRGWVLAHVGA